jgi:hypothetical protein
VLSRGGELRARECGGNRVAKRSEERGFGGMEATVDCGGARLELKGRGEFKNRIARR